MSAGISKGGHCQPSFCRAPAISSLPSGEPCTALVPALVGAPKPMVVRAAISVGRSERCAASMAEAIASGSWPSMRIVFQPDACEALLLVGRVGERHRPVDRNAVVVPEDDQPVQPEMAGERDRFLADALHQAAVAGKHIGPVVDEVVAELAFMRRSASAMPTALPSPWPSGPVVVSMPEAKPYSGMPGRPRSELAEIPDLLERHVLVAGEVEQRIEQHRAVAGRQHEAVAIGPVRAASDRS